MKSFILAAVLTLGVAACDYERPPNYNEVDQNEIEIVPCDVGNEVCK